MIARDDDARGRCMEQIVRHSSPIPISRLTPQFLARAVGQAEVAGGHRPRAIRGTDRGCRSRPGAPEGRELSRSRARCFRSQGGELMLRLRGDDILLARHAERWIGLRDGAKDLFTRNCPPNPTPKKSKPQGGQLAEVPCKNYVHTYGRVNKSGRVFSQRRNGPSNGVGKVAKISRPG